MEQSAPAPLRVLLGISGGIAAYKSCDLVRRLREAGADVRVVMTASATRFVTPLTFQALSGNPVRTALWDDSAEAAMGHIELARWAQQIVIAPASADLLARLAHGQADDLLTTLCLASAAPLSLAPAMNQQMWAHPATQANLTILSERGVRVLGPDSGSQACGDVGAGRMLEPAAIVAALLNRPCGDLLAGRRVLVSAGPTYEDIDPVRYLGNRSSGRMGFAVAAAALEQGAQVTLIAGPVQLATPAGVRRIDVRSARQMHAAVLEAVANCDIFVASAAVGDFRVEHTAEHKIKKRADGGLDLQLTQNPDILADVSRLPHRPFLVGFAAETENLLDNARAKLQRKQLDLIAANQVGGGLGFEADTNSLILLNAHGSEELPTASKCDLARDLVRRIARAYLGTNPASGATTA